MRNLHRWNVTPAEAVAIQKRLSSRVVARGGPRRPRTVAGVDLSIRDGRARAAVPVLGWDDQSLLDLAIAERPVSFPYVPGMLSFREAPAALEAFQSLTVQPDVVLVDAQGIAHPRRFGLAAHLGVLLDRPTVGCAKSRLVGTHADPGIEAGSVAELRDGGSVIGAVLRTRRGVKPLYVSVGHRVGLKRAIDLVLSCCRGFRLPEPLRLAHRAAGSRTPGKWQAQRRATSMSAPAS